MSRLDRKPSVLVVGSANMDLVVRCEEFPRPGQTILGSDFAMYPGGKGANQAVAAARLGAEVYFLGKLGCDAFRDRLRESLSSQGVHLDYVLDDAEAATGTALITVDGTGQNQIIVASGSNMKLRPEEVAACSAAFERADVVLLQLEIPLETVVEAVRQAKMAGCTVILNPAPARSLPRELIRQLDVITPNESESEALTSLSVLDLETAGAAAERLVEMGAGEIIVTLGAQGALHVQNGARTHHPCLVVEAVDSTAAGDAFNGALAFALASGLPHGEAIDLANAVAAYSVTVPGAQPSMPDVDALTAFAPEAAEALPALNGTPIQNRRK